MAPKRQTDFFHAKNVLTTLFEAAYKSSPETLQEAITFAYKAFHFEEVDEGRCYNETRIGDNSEAEGKKCEAAAAAEEQTREKEDEDAEKGRRRNSGKEAEERRVARHRTVLSDFKDANGRNALHFACAGRNSSNVELLLKLSTETTALSVSAATRETERIETPSTDTETALGEPQSSALSKTDKAQPDVAEKNPTDFVDSNGETPLLLAVRSNFHEIATLLLQFNANPNCFTETEGKTPLHFAADLCNVETVNLLIAAGAHVNACGRLCGTPLFVALSGGLSAERLRTAKALLDSGASPDSPFRCSESSVCEVPPPLVFACAQGNADTAEFLLTYENKDGARANANCCDRDGWTALHCAAEANSMSCVQLLLKHSADCNAITMRKSALDLATEAAPVSTLVTLLQQHTTVNADPPKRERKTESVDIQKPQRKVQSLALGNSQGIAIHATTCNGNTTVKRQSETKFTADVERLKLEGNKLSASGKFRLASDKYSLGLKLCPSDSKEVQGVLHSNRSFCMLKLGRQAEALQDAQKAVECRPDWSKAYYRLAEAYKAADNLDECAQQLWQAFMRDQRNAELAAQFRRTAEEAKKRHQTAVADTYSDKTS